MARHSNRRNFRPTVRGDVLPRLLHRIRLARFLSIHAVNYRGRLAALRVLHQQLTLLIRHYPFAVTQITLLRDRHDRPYFLFKLFDGFSVGERLDDFTPAVQKLLLERQQPTQQPAMSPIAA